MDSKALKKLMVKWIKLHETAEEAQAEADSVWAEIEAARGKTTPVEKKDVRAPRGSIGKAIERLLSAGKEFGVKDVLAEVKRAGGTVDSGSINAALVKMVKDEKGVKRLRHGVYGKG